MGTDCHLIFEIKSESSEDYEALGEYLTCRNYKAFEKLREYQNSGLPSNPSWEAKHAYSEYSDEGGYFSFGWMYYKDFMKHGGSKVWEDIFKTKVHDRIRVFMYFDN